MSDQPGDQHPIRSDRYSTPADGGASLRTAGVVHDVNQMLAVILGRAELLIQSEESDLRREDLAAIVLAAGDAAAMLKRLQQGIPPVPGRAEPVAVNLAEAVRDVALLIRPGGSGRWSESRDDSAGRSWFLDQTVPADLFTSVPGQVVREVLSNLLINALEVLPDGGRIRVGTVTDQARAVLVIQDSGPGLDKETAGSIFEPGFTTHAGGFRGIGLAGSRQLLKCFDGRLALGQDQGSGAQFLLDLPSVEPPVAEPETGSAASGETELRPASFPVLVVDDEPAVRGMLTDVLIELDCRVVAVRDAASALEEFAPGAFGLALVDQSLPGRSGLELAADLRKRDPCLAVALITGWGHQELLADVDPDIVDLTATKPLEWTRIIELVDKGESLNRQRRTSDEK